MNKIANILFIAIFAMVSFTACKNDVKKAESTKAADVSTTTTTKTNNPEVSSTVTTEPEVPVGPTTSMKFDNEVHDFGTVMEGDIVTHKFEFKNTGKEPLILTKVKPSCGCTTPTWPREPIAPGKTGVIEARFDSKGKGGVGGKATTKTITVTANTEPANTTLRIKGSIDKKAEQ